MTAAHYKAARLVVLVLAILVVTGAAPIAHTAQPARKAEGTKADRTGELFKRAGPAASEAREEMKSTTRVSDLPPLKADSYEQLPVDESLKDKRPAVLRMLRDGFGAGEQQTFNDYYSKYVFPRWTVPANITSLPSYRNDLTNDLRPSGEGGASVRNQLVEIALDFLTRFAKGKYHPAVRVNAMLGIGELYAQASGTVRSAQPLPAALPIMMEAVKSAEQIDAVKIAALVGIRRHGTLGIADAQYRDQEVVPTMLTIATTKVSPGRNPEGHAWVRTLAIDTLGELGSVGQQNAVVTALAGIPANAETHFLTRCAAARALGKLRYDPNAGLNAQQLTEQVARLAADALAYEADQETPDFDSMLLARRAGKKPGPAGQRAVTPIAADMRALGTLKLDFGKDRDRDRERTVPEKAAAVAGAGAGGARTVNVDPERTQLEQECSLSVRRRLLDRIDAVKDGLIGPRDSDRIGIVGLATPPTHKQYCDGVIDQLDEVVRLCEDDRISYQELIKRIKEQVPLLRTAIDRTPSEEAAGAEAPAAGASGNQADAPAAP